MDEEDFLSVKEWMKLELEDDLDNYLYINYPQDSYLTGIYEIEGVSLIDVMNKLKDYFDITFERNENQGAYKISLKGCKLCQ